GRRVDRLGPAGDRGRGRDRQRRRRDRRERGEPAPGARRRPGGRHAHGGGRLDRPKQLAGRSAGRYGRPTDLRSTKEGHLMKRRYVLGGVGVIAALALTSSALGGPSLQSLVKKEVAKQLSAAEVSKKGKRGPPGPQGLQGPAGTNGTSGTNGTPGTARAYAEVQPRGSGGCNGVMAPPQPCLFD